MTTAPRPGPGPLFGKYAVTRWDRHTGTVIGGAVQGAFAVADPRTMHRQAGDAYLSGGHYGVVPWNGQAGAVSAQAGHDNGRWSVADPRTGVVATPPAGGQKLVAMIKAIDGTWHRPFTTLELAALQSLIDPDEHWSSDPQTQREIDAAITCRANGVSQSLPLDGHCDGAWRERIGNAMPPDTVEAIAEVVGMTLLLARTGETFVLNAMPVWVRPIAIALSIAQTGP